MKTKRLFSCALLGFILLFFVVAGTKVSDMTQTTTLAWTNLLYVVTNPAAGGSRSITGSNLLQSLQTFSNWPITTFIHGTNSKTLYLSTNGNDATAVMGDPNKPWGSITNAVTNMVNDSTLLISPGYYKVRPVINNGGVADVPVSQLQLNNLTNASIIGAGPGVWIDGRDTNGDIFNIFNCKDLYVASLNIIGTNSVALSELADAPTNANWAVFNFYGTNVGLRFYNIGLVDHARQGFSHLFGTRSTTNVLYHGCWGYNIGSTNLGGHVGKVDGAFISGMGSYWTIRDCYVRHAFRGVELQHGDGVAGWGRYHDVKVLDNVFLDIWEYPISTLSYGYVDVEIKGNTVRGWSVRQLPYARGINVIDGHNISIIGNRVLDMNDIGIYGNFASNATNITIEGNYVQNCDQGIAIYDDAGTANGIRYPRIVGNYIYDCSTRGTYMHGVYGIMSDNVVVDCGPTGKAMVVADGSQEVRVERNYIGRVGAAATTHGIHVQSATNTHLFGNMIQTNSYSSGPILDGGVNTHHGFTMGDGNVRILYGNNSPEGAIVAPVGSLFLRTNGVIDAAAYVKTNGVGNTGWGALLMDPIHDATLIGTISIPATLAVANVEVTNNVDVEGTFQTAGGLFADQLRVTNAAVFQTNITVNGTNFIGNGGFRMTNGATDTYVLTSDADGIGTWQAAAGGGVGNNLTNPVFYGNPTWPDYVTPISDIVYGTNQAWHTNLAANDASITVANLGADQDILIYIENTVGYSNCTVDIPASAWIYNGTNHPVLPTNANSIIRVWRAPDGSTNASLAAAGVTIDFGTEIQASTNAWTGKITVTNLSASITRDTELAGYQQALNQSLSNLLSVQLFLGNATPEGAQTANIGSLFLNTNGSADSTLYMKTNGSGNTGWAAVLGAPDDGGGSGDVTGPASSIDNELVRFDGTTGKAIQGVGGRIMIEDDGALASTNGILTLRRTNAFSLTRLTFGATESTNLGLRPVNGPVPLLQFMAGDGSSAGALELPNITAAIGAAQSAHTRWFSSNAAPHFINPDGTIAKIRYGSPFSRVPVTDGGGNALVDGGAGLITLYHTNLAAGQDINVLVTNIGPDQTIYLDAWVDPAGTNLISFNGNTLTWPGGATAPRNTTNGWVSFTFTKSGLVTNSVPLTNATMTGHEVTINFNSEVTGTTNAQGEIDVALAASIARTNAPSLSTPLLNGFRGNWQSSNYIASWYVDVSNYVYQSMTLTGNLTLYGTNKGAGNGTTLFLTASGADRTVTFNDGSTWSVWGTNGASFVIPSGKKAYVGIVCGGSGESDVNASYEVAN